jgi:hypothetical protein
MVRDAAKAAARIRAFRDITASDRWGYVDGLAVDPFTATQVVATHDGMSLSAQALYRRQTADRMIAIAYNRTHSELRSRGRHR